MKWWVEYRSQATGQHYELFFPSRADREEFTEMIARYADIVREWEEASV